MKKVIEFAHDLINMTIKEHRIGVDMTVGNGKDTLFLCQNCQFVYGFDIQKNAIKNTYQYLKENHVQNFILYNTSHENITKTIFEKVDFIIYNLGYLPCGDKTITTTFQTTYFSLQESLKLLNDNGMMIIVVYPGHKEGKIESIKLSEELAKLNQKEYDVVKYEFINQINQPPYLLAISKKK